MKLKLRFEKNEFAYTTPITVGSFKIATNHALTVTINEKEKVTLTALPHFHHYTIQEWQFVLNDFFSDERNFSLENFNRKKPAFGLTETTLNGELLYIVEAVLFAAFQNKFPLPAQESVKINGLYNARLPFDQVPDCVKIKIRPGLAEDTSAAMRDCLAKNQKTLFRLDGNRTFESDSLLEFLNQLPQKNIQYIEEPFKNFSDSVLFKKMVSIPLAVDESLLPMVNHLEKIAPEDYLIVKPSQIGLSKSFEIAEAFPKKAVLSSSYETATAMKALYSIASLLPEQFHGLDTIKFLPKRYSI